jgi:hypothetical protein
MVITLVQLLQRVRCLPSRIIRLQALTCMAY